MKLNEQYIKLLYDAFLRGQDFVLLDYLSISQARKKNPSEQDRYYGMDVKSNLTYGIKEYPMRFIFVKSDGKIKRDRNRREKQIAKIETEIKNIQEKVGMPYYRDAKKLKEKIENLCKRYTVGKHLKIEFLTSDDGKAIAFSYKWNKEAIEKEAKLDGVYLLGTTLMEHPIFTVFRLFKEQHYSESANKDLKGPLRIRPVFLQNQSRIEALIFILFLSLMVYMLLERWYRNSVTEPSLRKTTTRTLFSFFRNYALTIMVSEDGRKEIPNSLNLIQNKIFSVLGLEFYKIYHKFT
jgi:transposase